MKHRYISNGEQLVILDISSKIYFMYIREVSYS